MKPFPNQVQDEQLWRNKSNIRKFLNLQRLTRYCIKVFHLSGLQELECPFWVLVCIVSRRDDNLCDMLCLHQPDLFIGAQTVLHPGYIKPVYFI